MCGRLLRFVQDLLEPEFHNLPLRFQQLQLVGWGVQQQSVAHRHGLPPRSGYVIQMTVPVAATQLEVRRSCAVAVIASAGGIHAIIELLSSLPKSFYPPVI